jgi:hypothetical protein
VILPLPTTPILIDVGDLPAWLIALIAGASLWKSWRAEHKLTKVAADMAQVKHETNGMRAALEAAKLAEGNLAGRKELHEEQASRASVKMELQDEKKND